MKRVEAMGTREQGLAFRNPNTRDPFTSNIRELNISNTKAWIPSNTKERSVSRH